MMYDVIIISQVLIDTQKSFQVDLTTGDLMTP